LGQNLDSVKRRFAARWRAIEELALRDDDFRSLCVDLADAEAAAVKWEHSASPKRDQRRAEYLELARDLASEIEAALDAASVIALNDRRSKGPQ
jgi:hypothetical protein